MEALQQGEKGRQKLAPVDVRLSTIEDKTRLRRKQIADKAADYIITGYESFHKFCSRFYKHRFLLFCPRG